jgi:hypothetical protein
MRWENISLDNWMLKGSFALDSPSTVVTISVLLKKLNFFKYVVLSAICYSEGKLV